MAVSNTHECVCLRVCACVDSNPGLVIAIVFIVALCLLAVVVTFYAPSCLVASTSARTPRLPVSFCLSPSTSPSSLLLSAPRFSQFFYMYLCLCTSTRTSPCLAVCLSVCLSSCISAWLSLCPSLSPRVSRRRRCRCSSSQTPRTTTTQRFTRRVFFAYLLTCLVIVLIQLNASIQNRPLLVIITHNTHWVVSPAYPLSRLARH